VTNYLDKVEPHAMGLEFAARDMERDGIGGDPNNGHAVILRKMAGDLRAQGARGVLPHSYNSAGSNLYASAEQPTNYGVSGTLRACAEAGLKMPAGNRFASVEELDRALTLAFAGNKSPSALSNRIELKSKLFAAGMVADETPAIDEKRILHVGKLLRAAGIPIPTYVWTVAEINAELDKTKLSPGDRIALKNHCLAAGLLQASDGMIEPPRSPPALDTRRALAVLHEIGLDAPEPGRKIGLGMLNAALAKAGTPVGRRFEIKSALALAGLID
jgi:hypothetical protein